MARAGTSIYGTVGSLGGARYQHAPSGSRSGWERWVDGGILVPEWEVDEVWLQPQLRCYRQSHVDNQKLLLEAIAQARKGLKEGGLPIGSVLADSNGEIVARGHNLRVQTGDPTAHAEIVCIRNAGRRRDWNRLVLVSTLSPCVMCTGTALLFKIPTVIIGENANFRGAEELFTRAGVHFINMDDLECKSLMRAFISQHPDLWNEDIGL